MYATSARVMKSPSRGTIKSWPVRPGKYARANISKKRCRVARAVASAGAACWIRATSLHTDRLICWLDTVQVIATRVRVIAIGDSILRMRTFGWLQIVQVRGDLSSISKHLASGGVTGLSGEAGHAPAP